MECLGGLVVCETTTDKSRDTDLRARICGSNSYFTNKKLMLKFHFAWSAIFYPQRETNLYLRSCVTIFKQLIISLYKSIKKITAK